MKQLSSQQRAMGTDQFAARELALPVLCFLASHRPLAFLASQCTYLLEPLLAILGVADWCAVVRRWSEGEAGDHLAALRAASTPSAVLPATMPNIDLQPPDPDQRGTQHGRV
jgi:hypothetical protein